MKPVAVCGVGVWAPGVRDVDALLSGAEDPEVTKPGAALLPRASRRRSTLLARAATDALEGALAGTGIPGSDVGLVLGTVAGELGTTFECLPYTIEDPATSSPTRFRNSVHNAALGHIGIALENRGYASAVTAKPDRLVPMSLLEGLAWLHEAGGHCAVIMVDAGWESAPHVPVATAVMLSTEPPEPNAVLGWLGAFDRDEAPSPPPCDVPDAVRANPASVGLEFLAGLRTLPSGRMMLGPASGDDPPWSIAWTRTTA